MDVKKEFPALNDAERNIMERYALEEIDDSYIINFLNEIYENYLVAHSKSVRILLLQKLLNVAGIYQLVPFRRFITSQAELHVIETETSEFDSKLPFYVLPSELLRKPPFDQFSFCSVSEDQSLQDLLQQQWGLSYARRILFFDELNLVPDASKESTSFSEVLTGTICIRLTGAEQGQLRDFFSILIDLVKQAAYLKLVYESSNRLISTHIRAGMNKAALYFLIDALSIEFINDDQREDLSELFKNAAIQMCSFVEAGKEEGSAFVCQLVENSKLTQKNKDALLRVLTVI